MTLPMILAPLFVLVLMTFVIGTILAAMRVPPLTRGEVRPETVSLRQPNWPPRALQVGYSFQNQFEMPVLFYILIALALPLRHADLVIVALSWVFVVTRFVHAGIFVTSNDLNYRSLAWFAGVLVVFAMWVYFALKILL